MLLHHLSLAGAPLHFFLHLSKDFSRDDRRVVVLHIVHRQFPTILLDPLADAVCDIGFLQQGIPNVLFIPKNVPDPLVRPSKQAMGGQDMLCLQLLLDLGQAASINILATR